ncbi:glycosyltransferase family protein [Brachybacterium sp. UNK5269]|uniref:glycosyltransferase family protein n=1 Tax=Brachybacterium sp. UNK5269 TaxID=3408576 RepID=UPI003BAF2AA3
MIRSILLYGDVNLRYRDGSRIWLESIVEVLRGAGSDVTLALKAHPEEDLEELRNRFGCTVLPPTETHRSRGAGMTSMEARDHLVEIDSTSDFDAIITRGYDIARALSTVERFEGRLWPYITDGPGFSPLSSDTQAPELARIAQHARRIFVQTEDARSVFEAAVPAATGKTLLLPPIVPDAHFLDADVVAARAEEDEKLGLGTEEAPLRLVYSGKFARPWKSLEIPFLPDRLAGHGVHARVTMIGDKIQNTKNDRTFPAEMRTVMARRSTSVTWAGGMQRAEAIQLSASADVGVSWRAESLDTSLEISTKLLEYGALGVAPLLNRTRAHERLLGADYPLFVDGDVVETLVRACDPELRRDAAARAHDAVQPFRASSAVERLTRYFSAQEPDLVQSPVLPSRHSDGKLRVLFSSHDFKFAGELIDVLRQRRDIELRIDRWTRLAHHDPDQSGIDGDWADVIICEWAGHNAVFHSQRKRPDQRLIVRFHGFEVRGAWLKDIDVDAVDAVVFVSDFYRREILEKTGWPESKTTVIPNVVDLIDLHREKLDDARFHLGLAGYVPMLKRPDRAVDLLEALVAEDDRFMLHLRGRAPWSYPWEWAKPMQRDAYMTLFDRIRRSPQLRSNILFEDFAPDMGSWFRGIGWVLSTSTQETFHLAPVEGMASGALPLVWSRPGASEIFSENLFDNVEDVARFVLDTVRTPGAYEEQSVQAVERAQVFDMSVHRRSWLDLLDVDRSTPLPLRGVPLVDTVPEDGPRNPVQVAAVAQKQLTAGDTAAAMSTLSDPAVAEPGEHAHKQLLAVREQALLVEGLREGSWIPVDGLGPVHRPARGSDEHPVLQAPASVPGTPLGATHVLEAADALVTAARRKRPALIRGGADATGTIAAAVAARRLGIGLELTDEGRAAVAEADIALPGLAEAFYEALDRTAEPIDLTELTVGIVADTFTMNAVSSTIRTVPIPRHGWEEALADTPVDVVLAESAWSSPDEEWFHGVAYHGDDEAADLRAILAHARALGIPTVFWNREDPVHLRSFKIPAADFDTVLTSDAHCITEYQSSVPSRTHVVASMPFFADPQVMHPLSPGENQDDAFGDHETYRAGEAHRQADARAQGETVAYAGTYYGDRFPQRTVELRGILSAAADFGLAIYDRQATVEGSRYELPPDLAPFSRGGVGAALMPSVYRRHPVHLNVNSVTDSPTMFSRRVVEIAASGSVVLSGKGQGVRTVLGDAFPVLESAEEWSEALAELTSDPTAWRTMAWAQMRAVHRAFTSARSLTLALRIAGLPVRAAEDPTYGVLVPLSSNGAADVLLSQSLLPDVVAITDGDADRDRYLEAGVRVVELDEAAGDLDAFGDVDWVGVLDPAVGPTHYEDLLIATTFGDWGRLASRPGPVSREEIFAVSSAVPPPAEDVAGYLYSRGEMRTAQDLVTGRERRTYTWIRDDRATAGSPGGD